MEGLFARDEEPLFGARDLHLPQRTLGIDELRATGAQERLLVGELAEEGLEDLGVDPPGAALPVEDAREVWVLERRSIPLVHEKQGSVDGEAAGD